MAVQHSTTADAFTPEDYGKLVDLATKAKSVAANTATVVSTNRHKINFPKWVSDPAVGWYAELAEISETDPTTGEVEVTPTKTAGITRISREMRDDSSPEVANLVGSGLANQITRSLDAAYLGDSVSDGPSGLLSISYTPVPASLTNLDSFVSARYAAEARGSKLTSWIVSPSVAEELSKLKTNSSDSNESLIAFVEDGLQIVGLPVLVSDQVDADTIAWGIPSEHVVAVLRQGTEVVASGDAAFKNDAVLIRAVARWGFGFLNEPGVVRLLTSPIEYAVTATGDGTFTVKINGVETAAVNEDVSAANLKTAIVNVDDGIEAADVTVTGSAGAYSVTIPALLSKGTDTGSTVSAVSVA